jgi:hypothetical protein
MLDSEEERLRSNKPYKSEARNPKSTRLGGQESEYRIIQIQNITHHAIKYWPILHLHFGFSQFSSCPKEKIEIIYSIEVDCPRNAQDEAPVLVICILNFGIVSSFEIRILLHNQPPSEFLHPLPNRSTPE